MDIIWPSSLKKYLKNSGHFAGSQVRSFSKNDLQVPASYWNLQHPSMMIHGFMDYCSIINSLESFRIPRSIEDPSISQIFRWWDLLPPVRHTWPRYIESSVARQSKGSMLRTSVGRDSRKSPSLSDAKHHQCVVTCFSCFEMRISNIVLVLSESTYIYIYICMQSCWKIWVIF